MIRHGVVETHTANSFIDLYAPLTDLSYSALEIIFDNLWAESESIGAPIEVCKHTLLERYVEYNSLRDLMRDLDLTADNVRDNLGLGIIAVSQQWLFGNANNGRYLVDMDYLDY